MVQIKIKKIKDGTLPSYKREGDVCMDCRSRVYLTLAQGERAIREAPKVEWEVVSELSETNRNDKGFGSTGLK